MYVTKNKQPTYGNQCTIFEGPESGVSEKWLKLLTSYKNIFYENFYNLLPKLVRKNIFLSSLYKLELNVTILLSNLTSAWNRGWTRL